MIKPLNYGGSCCLDCNNNEGRPGSEREESSIKGESLKTSLALTLALL